MNDVLNIQSTYVCSDSSLTEFNEINKTENTLHTGSISYEGPWNEVENRPTYYERYMTIGFKSEYNK